MNTIKLDYSDVQFSGNGQLKLLIIVGTRPGDHPPGGGDQQMPQVFRLHFGPYGQNYDYNLNGIFFRDLKPDDPEVYMDAVGDDLGATMGNIINASYKLMVQTHRMPCWCLATRTRACLSLSQTVAYPDLPHGGWQPMLRRVSARGDQPPDRGHHFRCEYVLFRSMHGAI